SSSRNHVLDVCCRRSGGLIRARRGRLVFCLAWKCGMDCDSSLARVLVLAAFPYHGFRVGRKCGFVKSAAVSSLLSILLPDSFGLRIPGSVHHHRIHVAAGSEYWHRDSAAQSFLLVCSRAICIRDIQRSSFSYELRLDRTVACPASYTRNSGRGFLHIHYLLPIHWPAHVTIWQTPASRRLQNYCAGFTLRARASARLGRRRDCQSSERRIYAGARCIRYRIRLCSGNSLAA